MSSFFNALHFFPLPVIPFFIPLYSLQTHNLKSGFSVLNQTYGMLL